MFYRFAICLRTALLLAFITNSASCRITRMARASNAMQFVYGCLLACAAAAGPLSACQEHAKSLTCAHMKVHGFPQPNKDLNGVYTAVTNARAKCSDAPSWTQSLMYGPSRQHVIQVAQDITGADVTIFDTPPVTCGRDPLKSQAIAYGRLSSPRHLNNSLFAVRGRRNSTHLAALQVTCQCHNIIKII